MLIVAEFYGFLFQGHEQLHLLRLEKRETKTWLVVIVRLYSHLASLCCSFCASCATVSRCALDSWLAVLQPKRSLNGIGLRTKTCSSGDDYTIRTNYNQYIIIYIYIYIYLCIYLRTYIPKFGGAILQHSQRLST